ncbi:hypothetical protein ACIHFE_34065 [Streptomyces sp. NPDC052396]|uniref:hypothetical protein n=1 Tax=Streptomyces sp. NPDC052396 TaxID=3365689 RepID=UPI0037D941AB
MNNVKLAWSSTARKMLLPMVGVATSLILMGCSSMNVDPDSSASKRDKAESKLGYKPEVRPVKSAEEEVNAISSKLLDWMGVQGKVTQPGAALGTCEAIDPELKTHYKVQHPWSVYDLKKGTFEEAMKNLRQKLPKHGWTITKDGETKSEARNPEIVAENASTHHVVRVEWAKNRSGGLKQLISVDVDSRCYEAPEGTQLK